MKKIFIAQPLLNLLKTDVNLKAAVRPRVDGLAYIDRLLSEDLRVFEQGFACSNPYYRDSLCDRVLMTFNKSDIENIKKLQRLVTILNVELIAGRDNCGSSDFNIYCPDDNLSKARQNRTFVYKDEIESFGALPDVLNGEIRAYKLRIYDLTCEYPDGSLMSYADLLKINTPIVVMLNNGDKTDLTDHRTNINPDALDQAISQAIADNSLTIYEAHASSYTDNFKVVVAAENESLALNAARRLFSKVDTKGLVDFSFSATSLFSCEEINAIKSGIIGTSNDTLAIIYARLTGIDCAYLGNDTWTCNDQGENWIAKHDALTRLIIKNLCGNPERFAEAISSFSKTN